MRQVRAATLIGYDEVARFAGLDPFEMLSRAGIDAKFLEDTENRHAAAPIVKLLEDSAELSGCESFGLLMAECRPFPTLGPLSLLLEHLPTVADVVEAIIDYRRLVNDIVTLEYQPGRECSLLRWTIAPGYGKTQIVDLTVAVGYRVLTGASGGRWHPEAVHFVHPAPRDLAPFRRTIPDRLEFGSSFNGYSCTAESMTTPTIAPDRTMARNVRWLLDLVPLPSELSPVGDRVRRSIALLLPKGKASLAAVAANLGMSPRALQRSLASEHTSFAALLNEVRRDLAQRYLSSSAHSIESVSEFIGYSSSSAFTRWFASEFQSPPSSWRRSESDERTEAQELEGVAAQGFR